MEVKGFEDNQTTAKHEGAQRWLRALNNRRGSLDDGRSTYVTTRRRLSGSCCIWFGKQEASLLLHRAAWQARVSFGSQASLPTRHADIVSKSETI